MWGTEYHTADLPATDVRVWLPGWVLQGKAAAQRFNAYLLPFGPNTETLAFVLTDTALGRRRENRCLWKQPRLCHQNKNPPTGLSLIEGNSWAQGSGLRWHSGQGGPWSFLTRITDAHHTIAHASQLHEWKVTDWKIKVCILPKGWIFGIFLED